MSLKSTFSALLISASAFGVGAVAAPQADAVPARGSHFHLSRSGTVVRVTGVDLKVFSEQYMTVHPSDFFGTRCDTFSASPYGGANFPLETHSTQGRIFDINLTVVGSSKELCAGSYSA